MSPYHMMPGDSDAVRDARIAEGTAKRVWEFARPYRGTIVLFLVAILFLFIGIFRLLGELIGVEVAYAVIGGLFLLGGVLLLSQRKPRTDKD